MAKKNSNHTNVRNKWIFIIAAFVILFIFFLAVKPTYVKAPTQTTNTSSSETANWKTYTYTAPNGSIYSIKYPPDWTTSTDKSAAMVKFLPPGIIIKDDLPNKNSEYVEIYFDNFNPSNCRGDCPYYGKQISLSELININPSNYEATEGYMATMCACNTDKLFLKNGNNYYNFALYGLPDSNLDDNNPPLSLSSESKRIFKLMLSTFKFTQ